MATLEPFDPTYYWQRHAPLAQSSTTTNTQASTILKEHLECYVQVVLLLIQSPDISYKHVYLFDPKSSLALPRIATRVNSHRFSFGVPSSLLSLTLTPLSDL